MRPAPSVLLVLGSALACLVGSAVLSCSDDGAVAAAAPACTDVELLVAASGYQQSSVVCGAPGCAVIPGRTSGADLGDDPMLVASRGRAFFLARERDNLFELDPACGTVISQRVSLRALARTDPGSANPHDVAAAPDGTLFVALYAAGRIGFVKDGKLDGPPLDLSSYDPDGNPQPDAVSIVDVGGIPKAFVTLERLDDANALRSVLPSQMLRIDVASRKPEAVIPLEGRNPFNPMAELDGALFLAEPGNFDDAGERLAGIERFDTRTSTTKLLVHERDLGGSVSEVAITERCGVAIVASPEAGVNATALVAFDPESGAVLRSIAAPVLGPTPGYDLQALAWRGRTLYVGDRRDSAGGFSVHVLERTGDCTLVETGRTIKLPQPPVALRAANPR